MGELQRRMGDLNRIIARFQPSSGSNGSQPPRRQGIVPPPPPRSSLGLRYQGTAAGWKLWEKNEQILVGHCRDTPGVNQPYHLKSSSPDRRTRRYTSADRKYTLTVKPNVRAGTTAWKIYEGDAESDNLKCSAFCRENQLLPQHAEGDDFSVTTRESTRTRNSRTPPPPAPKREEVQSDVVWTHDMANRNYYQRLQDAESLIRVSDCVDTAVNQLYLAKPTKGRTKRLHICR